MNVAAVLMEILRSAGVRRLFGNPGTTELPFLDALPDSGLEYVVGLQEATAVAAADGYAKRGIYPGMDLVEPEIDYAGLARSLGVRAERVDKPGDLRDVLASASLTADPRSSTSRSTAASSSASRS